MEPLFPPGWCVGGGCGISAVFQDFDQTRQKGNKDNGDDDNLEMPLDEGNLPEFEPCSDTDAYP